MAKQTITREIQSVSVQEQSTAIFGDWNLNFTTAKDGDRVISVNVYGQKDQQNVSASLQDNGYVNIGFSEGARDDALYIALLDELDVIKGGSAE